MHKFLNDIRKSLLIPIMGGLFICAVSLAGFSYDLLSKTASNSEIMASGGFFAMSAAATSALIFIRFFLKKHLRSCEILPNGKTKK